MFVVPLALTTRSGMWKKKSDLIVNRCEQDVIFIFLTSDLV